MPYSAQKLSIRKALLKFNEVSLGVKYSIFSLFENYLEKQRLESFASSAL